ncbi:hypothetical protein fh0823_09440 [Francisella halioticida]|nr:hypothetical protein fh0823_09440 [Francisella halioticida]
MIIIIIACITNIIIPQAIYMGASEKPLNEDPDTIKATKKYKNILAIILSLFILLLES